MYAVVKKITLDGTWQSLSAAGLKSFFVGLEIENIGNNTNSVEVRYSADDEPRKLNPGDQTILKTNKKESFQDSGIQVNGTAGEIVKFEAWYYDHQQTA